MDELKHSILIIDDQETIISVLTSMLGSEYNIFSAQNGREGIEAARNYSPDIILLDVMMTEMDGYEVITELKKIDETKKIPVIFITSLADNDNEERALTLGAADYFTKPFSPAIIKLRLKYQIKILTQLHTVEKFSMMDQLTEIPNRRSFDVQIKKEWARSLREKTIFSILMIDLDNFKKYNDTYGHLQGDVVLKEVVKVFFKILKRPGDFAARWGGEEFVILLPCTDSRGAFEIAEQIRKGVENIDILLEDNTVTKMTISIGANTHEYNQGGTIDDFVDNADKALYEAKGNGRNLVCVFEK